MKKLLLLTFLMSGQAFAQPHVTQPFRYFWDEPTVNVNGSPSVQVNHFEMQIDTGTFVSVGIPVGSFPSTTVGLTTFPLPADPALPIGAHTFAIRSCATAASGVSCSTSAPFAFVLDQIAPPTASRLGVGQ